MEYYENYLSEDDFVDWVGDGYVDEGRTPTTDKLGLIDDQKRFLQEYSISIWRCGGRNCFNRIRHGV